MYLKSLELQGFKSFPDKIKLEFGKGITAVVGPNGSGKSNIGDAVRWVLGEQSSKTLRGSKMEDVIFAGTELRRPMGSAAVTLNIVNDKGLLSIDAPEVSVTRRLYRSGESEYLINGAQVRLKDVSELFMDTGLGRDGYSIIGQGRVAEIVSSKSGERRDIFEEAAGISKFRYRKAEAERRLGQAEDNILRLTDIIGELESRVGPLKNQSEKAEKFLLLREEQKSLEITAWMTSLDELKAKARELEDKLLINTAEYENLCADMERFEEEQRIISGDIVRGNIRIEKMNEEQLEAEKANHDIHRDIGVRETEISYCEKDIAALEEQLKNSELSAGENKRLTEEKLLLIKELDRRIISAREEYDAAAREFTEAAAKQDGFEKELSGNSEKLSRLYIRRSELKVTAENALRSLSEIKEQTESEKLRREQAEREREQLAAEYKDISDGLAAIAEKRGEQTNRISGMKRLFESKNSKLMQGERDLRECEIAVREKKQRLQLLRDLENSMEGFARAPKEVLKAGRNGRISGIIGSVAQIISVPPEYSLAVETALGAALQNIVTENEDAAKRGIRLLKEINGGRATFLPLTSVNGSRIKENGLDNCTGFVALGCDIVRCEPKFTGIINSLLGRTAVAEDIDSAASIAKKYGYRFRIVTLDGQVVNAGGSFTGGSANRTGGVLTRKNEIERLEKEIEAQMTDFNALKEKCAALKAETDKMRIGLDAENDEIMKMDQDKIRFETELKRISQVSEQAEASGRAAAEMTEKLEKRRRELTLSYENALAEQEKNNALIAEGERQSSSDIALREEFKSQRERLSAAMTDARIRQTELEKDKDAARESIAALEEQSRNIGDSSVRISLDIEEKRRKIEENRKLIEEQQQNIRQAGDREKQIAAEISRIREENRENERKNSEIRIKMKDASDRRERAGAEKTRLEERIAACRSDSDKIISDMEEQYGLYPSEAEKLMLADTEKNEVISRLRSVKQKISALGTINVSAIEEYKEVSERYTFMSGQLSDVTSSKKELEKLIDDLTETMKQRFSESFARINENFKRIFVELFGGGRAELKLTEPDDVLNSGIEINVAPPGKVIKSLSLLSGGEQAFVAIAIYFAILKIKPAPFCILDEIEAALDDVNVSRYAHYLRNFTDTTQFITVTHRRGTMEEADVMYGVTMQEKGISRLLKMEQPPPEDIE